MRLRVLILALLVGCGSASEHRAARGKYNEGVTALAAGKLDDAEKALQEALRVAGLDPELRWRVAFNLGMVCAEQAKAAVGAEPPDTDKALDKLHQAIAWFGDAARQKPGDKDTRTNLELVQRRAQALADQMDNGKKLEARLEQVTKDERALRDEDRAIWSELAARHDGDPLAGGDALTGLADRQRMLLAEAGVIGDLAADELASIEGKAEDQRSDEDKARTIQLQNLDVYLQKARAAMAEARRHLQKRGAELAHARIEAALDALGRAREQLLDPVKVLQGIAADQLESAQLVAVLDEDRRGGVSAATGGNAKAQELPAWLTASEMADRQLALRDRLGELTARLEAGVAQSDAPVDGGTPASPEDPQAAADKAKLMIAVRAALIEIKTADTSMGSARDALTGSRIGDAVPAQRDALMALARAIEQFAELRQVIDIAWSTEQQMVAALTSAELPAAERGRVVHEGAAQNLARVRRLAGMLADEVAKAEAQANAPADPNDPNAAATAEQAKQQIEAMKAQLAQAETLRAQAEAALVTLGAALDGKGKPEPPAQVALDRLTELRKLFYSVIEHLQELVREQTDTRDRTATAQAEDDDGRAPLLPGLVDRQTEHGGKGKAIAAALAEQADAAGQGGDPKAADKAKAMADAAAEVDAAVTEMTTAQGNLTEARDQAGNVSHDLEPSLDAQAKALEHLENALRLLQPPPPPKQDQDQQKQDQDQQQQQQDQDKQKQDQQQQDQAKQQQDQQQQSQRQQSVREREEQRAKDRKEHQRIQPDPVDKDW